jgi:hypothetical protein
MPRWLRSLIQCGETTLDPEPQPPHQGQSAAECLVVQTGILLLGATCDQMGGNLVYKCTLHSSVRLGIPLPKGEPNRNELSSYLGRRTDPHVLPSGKTATGRDLFRLQDLILATFSNSAL